MIMIILRTSLEHVFQVQRFVCFDDVTLELVGVS